MIILVVADDKNTRTRHIDEVITGAHGAEVLIHDDTSGTLSDLEHYLYPSLFSIVPPIVQIKFMVATNTDEMNTSFLKKLSESPTVFIFEEWALPTPIVTAFKKAGAVIHTAEKKISKAKAPDLFAIVSAIITAADKKSRWMTYRRALEGNAIEAIIGIMYWKVRDMAAKGNKEKYMELYKQLLSAHARAWESGTPLELMIEKVLLT